MSEEKIVTLMAKIVEDKSKELISTVKRSVAFGHQEEEEIEIPEEPLEVKHGILLIYPDLILVGESYQIAYKGRVYLIGKPDKGIISVMEVTE